jgi:hypothetical protein
MKNWPRPKNKKEVERPLGWPSAPRNPSPGPGYRPGKPEPLSNLNPSAPG